MQDVLAKLKEIQENYDNEDMQAAVAAAEVTQPVAETEAVEEEAVVEEETVEEATDEVVDEAEETVEEVHEEEVTESVDKDAAEFERMLKLAGQSGVIGMSTNNILVTESVEVSEETVEEEAFVAKEADDEEVDDEEVDESFETVEEETVEEETVEVPVSALQELMKLAGYEEYKIDEYANEPQEEYGDTEDQMALGGGLNGPKDMYPAAADGDNPMDQEPRTVEEDDKLTFEGMYKRYMTQVVEETLEEE